jgi:PhnB protein
MASTSSASWKPAGYQAAVPTLQVPNCKAALDFWKAAFNAEILHVHLSPDGAHVNHALLRLGEIVFQAMEPAPEKGYPPTVLEIFLYSPDTDAAFERAVAAGATPKEKPADRVSR